MSSNGALELRPGTAVQRAGQATMVEQSRAVAEVHAMVVVAQQMPRNIDRADREMRRSCSRLAMAEKAFYSYRRGGQQVTGETIVLATELARCWGNIDYGLAELRRDDFAGESEMMAFAWDLETNTRPRTTFIVPHVRTGNSARMTDPRDVYENNTNMGNRRMREMILKLMPPWFVEDAKALCYATLAADTRDGATLGERAAKAVERFAGIGVRPEQIAQRLGAPQAAWSAADLATLSVIFRSIERRETTKEDEFGSPSGLVTAADLAPPKAPSPAAPDAPPASGPAATPTPTADVAAAGEGLPAADGTPGDERHKALVGVAQQHFRRLRYTDADKQARLRHATDLVLGTDVPTVSSLNDLTHAELGDLNRVLERCKDRAALQARLTASAQDDAGEARGNGGGDGE